MSRPKIFRISYSVDGVTWTYDEKDDGDVSFAAIRKAREQSESDRRYIQVTNLELNVVLIRFFRGMALPIQKRSEEATSLATSLAAVTSL